MGCYQCGSSAGDVSRLCPKCNQERLQLRRAGSSAHRFTYQQSERTYSPSIVTPTFIIQIIGALVLVAVTGYFLCFSSYGPGIALSPADRVLARCKREMNSSSLKEKMLGELKAKNLKGIKRELTQGMEHVMMGFATGFGAAMCEAMADECRKDPRSRHCKQALKMFK